MKPADALSSYQSNARPSNQQIVIESELLAAILTFAIDHRQPRAHGFAIDTERVADIIVGNLTIRQRIDPAVNEKVLARELSMKFRLPKLLGFARYRCRNCNATYLRWWLLS